MTFGAPQTMTVLPPNSSLSRACTLSSTALVVTHGFGRSERDLVRSPRIVVNEGDLVRARASAVRTRFAVTVGRVHQGVQVGHWFAHGVQSGKHRRDADAKYLSVAASRPVIICEVVLAAVTGRDRRDQVRRLL